MLATEMTPWQQNAKAPQIKLKASRYEQFEIWQLTENEWERLAYFQDLEVASAMAQPRSNPIQLKRAKYDEGNLVEEEILAELGARRGNE